MHHSCFTRRRQLVRHTSTFPHQAPDSFLPRLKFPSESAEGPFKEEPLRRNCLVINCLLVLIIIPFEFEGALVLKPTVPSSPRLLKHR